MEGWAPVQLNLINIGITPPSPGIRYAQTASHDSVNVLLCKPGLSIVLLPSVENEITSHHSIVFTFKDGS